METGSGSPSKAIWCWNYLTPQATEPPADTGDRTIWLWLPTWDLHWLGPKIKFRFTNHNHHHQRASLYNSGFAIAQNHLDLISYYCKHTCVIYNWHYKHTWHQKYTWLALLKSTANNSKIWETKLNLNLGKEANKVTITTSNGVSKHLCWNKNALWKLQTGSRYRKDLPPIRLPTSVI